MWYVLSYFFQVYHLPVMCYPKLKLNTEIQRVYKWSLSNDACYSKKNLFLGRHGWTYKHKYPIFIMSQVDMHGILVILNCNKPKFNSEIIQRFSIYSYFKYKIH